MSLQQSSESVAQNTNCASLIGNKVKINSEMNKQRKLGTKTFPRTSTPIPQGEWDNDDVSDVPPDESYLVWMDGIDMGSIISPELKRKFKRRKQHHAVPSQTSPAVETLNPAAVASVPFPSVFFPTQIVSYPYPNSVQTYTVFQQPQFLYDVPVQISPLYQIQTVQVLFQQYLPPPILYENIIQYVSYAPADTNFPQVVYTNVGI